MPNNSRKELSICIDDVEANSGREGLNYVLMSGGDDGNWVHVLEVPPGYTSEAHYHDYAQFQVVIKGTVDMAGHVLTPGSLHYTDAGTPYGPFTAGPEGLTMMVIRPGAEKKGRRIPTRTVIDKVKAAQQAQDPESA
jgi:uncharacterized RmlC-like cupin family protein